MSFYIEVRYQEPKKVAPSAWLDVVSSSSHLADLLLTGNHDGKKLHSLRLQDGDVFEFSTRRWIRKRLGA
jgi:hypothetical protein